MLDKKGDGPHKYVYMSSKVVQYWVREGKEGRRWHLSMQKWEQKSKPVLLIKRYITQFEHNFHTNTIMIIYGMPSGKTNSTSRGSVYKRHSSFII